MGPVTTIRVSTLRHSSADSVTWIRFLVRFASIVVVGASLLIGRAFADTPPPAGPGGVERWYSGGQVERGASVYAAHCVACHGPNAEGTENWRQRGADGKFPPPPIDGSGHAWHHPMRVLGAQIKFGAPGGKGSMPGFADKLSDAQIIDVIAWIQSKWPDKIYAAWAEIQQRSDSSN